MPKYVKKYQKNFTNKDLLDMDWNDISKLKWGEILPLTNLAIARAKQRQTKTVKYLRENNMITPTALRYTAENKKINGKYKQIEDFSGYADYDFSLDTKYIGDINYLRYKLKMAQSFLKTKTSTISGFKEVMKDTIKTIERKSGLKLESIGENVELEKKTWKLISILRKSDKIGWGSLASETLITFVDAYVSKNNEKTIEQMYSELEGKSDLAYLTYNQFVERHNDENDEDDDVFSMDWDR